MPEQVFNVKVTGSLWWEAPKILFEQFIFVQKKKKFVQYDKSITLEYSTLLF